MKMSLRRAHEDAEPEEAWQEIISNPAKLEGGVFSSFPEVQKERAVKSPHLNKQLSLRCVLALVLYHLGENILFIFGRQQLLTSK